VSARHRQAKRRIRELEQELQRLRALIESYDVVLADLIERGADSLSVVVHSVTCYRSLVVERLADVKKRLQVDIVEQARAASKEREG